jgi:hypothetical protein
MIHLLQNFLADIGQQRNVPVHSLDRAFKGHKYAEYQIRNDAHWNAFGHQLVADDVALFFQEAGILAPGTEDNLDPDNPAQNP